MTIAYCYTLLRFLDGEAYLTELRRNNPVIVDAEARYAASQAIDEEGLQTPDVPRSPIGDSAAAADVDLTKFVYFWGLIVSHIVVNLQG